MRGTPPAAPEDARAPIVILGAGLSGLSLAVALREAAVTTPIVLIDRRRSWTRDRTWCTWLTPGLRFGECVTHRWTRWRTVSPEREAHAASTRHPYVHLDAAAVYTRARDRLAAFEGVVEFRTGTAILGVEPGPRPRVHTAAGTLEADVVYDALGAHSPLAGRRAGHPSHAWAQRFLGWEVEVDRPRFDPSTATLMDFRPHAGAGVTFLYVLPFSPTRALLEHTSIEPVTAARVDREAALAVELSDGLGVSDFQLLRSERGVLAMSSAVHPGTHGERVFTVGAAAGAIRPSSGYAFSRIQRHVTALAAAHAAGRPGAVALTARRYGVLDRIFLTALERAGEPSRWFTAMAAAPGDSYARFMTDSGGAVDDARLMATLPWGEMGAAAMAALSGSESRRELLAGWRRRG